MLNQMDSADCERLRIKAELFEIVFIVLIYTGKVISETSAFKLDLTT
jgi:hypothetical protein